MSIIKLRPYQDRDFLGLRSLINQGYKSVLYQLPCGAGKTIIASNIAHNAALRGKRTMFTVHRKELIEQSSRTLQKFQLEHGIIAPGHSMTADHIQVASIQTVQRRLDRIIKPDVLIIDEAHHAKAKTWEAVIKAFPDAVKIGLSATPCRQSGESLGDIFQTMLIGPSMKELIKAGYLSDYDYYKPPADIDLSKCKIQYGDYKKSDIEAQTNKPTITGDAVKHYLRLASGLRCIAFCISIDHAANVAAEFRKYGIAAQHIDSKMNQYQRDSIITSFRNGNIMVLANVDIVSEGFDLDCVECVSLLRPTTSLSLFIQHTGRPLRPSKNRAVIIDHVNNINNFGFPDADREWSLNGNYVHKRDKAPIERVHQCQKCYYVYSIKDNICPACGAEWSMQPHVLKYVEAELEKADRERIEGIAQQQERRERWKEQAELETLEDFERYAIKKGYKLGWALHRYKYFMQKKRGKRDAA